MTNQSVKIRSIKMSYAVCLSLICFYASTCFASPKSDDAGCEFMLSARGDYAPESPRPWLNDESLSLEEKIYREFLFQATGFLADHFRWPVEGEADRILRFAKKMVVSSLSPGGEEQIDLEGITAATLLSQKSVMENFRHWFPSRYLYLRRKIVSAYIRAVRQSDLEKRYRTVPTTPSEELFFLAAIKAKTNGGSALMLNYLQEKLTIGHFLDLFQTGRSQSERTGLFPQPLIFPGGWDEVELAARMDSPSAFAQFIDSRQLLTAERGQKTIAAIEKSPGFVVINWSSGKPVARDFLEALIRYIEIRGYILLVGVSQQIFEGLPEIFLTHPKIHLLSHSIENDSIRMSIEPVNPDIENPLPDLRKAGRYRPGQISIVFHPHLMMETVPTATNEAGPVFLISTGSINEPFSVFSAASQGRRKIANKTFHTTRGWVFEKGDLLTGFDSDGVQNAWHFRPLSYYDDRTVNGTVGFIDMGVNYRFKYDENSREFATVPEDVEVIYLGDPHDPETDPRVAVAMMRDLNLPQDTEATFMGGDTFDFGVITHHLDGLRLEQAARYQKDSLSLLNSINGVIQMVNGLQQKYPLARYAQIVGNHDEWLKKVLNRTPDIQNVINGDVLDELAFAVGTLRINLWEYIFKERRKVLEPLLRAFPDKRAEIIGRFLPVHDPDRIDILDRVSFFVGPEHRKNSVGGHGDRAAFGKRNPSLKDHAKGMPAGGGVTGHSHRPGIYLNSMDPGTFGPTVPDYSRGFYSGSAQGLVLIYANGTKQLLLYNKKVGGFRQHQTTKVIDPKKFFGQDRLKLVLTDNEKLDKSEALAVIWKELDRLKELIREHNDVSKRN